jgi:hypothetical protein
MDENNADLAVVFALEDYLVTIKRYLLSLSLSLFLSFLPICRNYRMIPWKREIGAKD